MHLFKVKVKVLVAQLCPTIFDPMDCNLPGSSVHVILQARILECIATPLICPCQGSNLGLLHCRQILYHLTHQEAIADSKINPSSALPRLSLQTIFAQPSGHPLVNEK